MKTVRALILLFTSFAAAAAMASVSTHFFAIGVCIAFVAFQIAHLLTGETVYARTGIAMGLTLLLILSRNDFRPPQTDASDVIFDPQSHTTTLSAEFMNRVKSERKALHDSDREKWRQEMQERLQRMKR